jgi:hypothetical protein
MIPNPFPAATAAASGPVADMALLLPDRRGQEHGPAIGQDATACSGGDVPPITADGPGEWLQSAAEPSVQRSGVDCRAVVSLPHECAASRDSGAWKAMVTERGHMTGSQSGTSGAEYERFANPSFYPNP